jgi:hypothetical protein
MLKFVLLLAGAPLLVAQSGSAGSPDPAAEANARLPGDGILVKALQLVTPATRGPLTEKERFREYVGKTFTWDPLARESVSAALEQWRDSNHEWGQGMQGFGKRLGSDLAYNGIRNTITYGASCALREDNRYFASGKARVAARILHAVKGPFIAHRDGYDSFSFSNLAGIVGASVAQLAWVPPSGQGASDVARSVGTSYSVGIGFDIAREFVPGLIRRLRGR